MVKVLLEEKNRKSIYNDIFLDKQHIVSKQHIWFLVLNLKNNHLEPQLFLSYAGRLEKKDLQLNLPSIFCLWNIITVLDFNF